MGLIHRKSKGEQNNEHTCSTHRSFDFGGRAGGGVRSCTDTAAHATPAHTNATHRDAGSATDRHASPANGHPSPPDGHPNPANGHAGSTDGHTSPANGYTSPADRHPNPANRHAGAANRYADPADGYASPANAHSGPDGGPPARGSGHSTSGKVQPVGGANTGRYIHGRG